jgi:transmembrane protein EpsG
MILYWSMLIYSFLMGSMRIILPRKVILENGKTENRTSILVAVLVFGYLIFFIGLRSGIADTFEYIRFFKALPSSLSAALSTTVDRDKGFYFFSVFVKQYISSDYHVWLFIIALVSGVCVMFPLYKYSTMFELSAFLFIASAQFTYMLNGMRQFIAVAILFMCMDLMIKRRWLPFCLITLLLSTIHGSAIIMIPFYFIVHSKPWSKKILITILGFGLAFTLFGSFLSSMTDLLESTQYSGYNDMISDINGSSIFRLLIAFIPCILAYIKKDEIEKLNNPVLNLSINMSVINACFYLLSTAGGGIFIGRMTIYFDVYNLLLYPLLFSEVYAEKERHILYYFCMVSFILFFYYQMVVTFNLFYMSDILKLYLH